MSRECPACEGAGRIPFEGTPGAFYRDGEKYDPPGWEECDDCGGSGVAPYDEQRERADFEAANYREPRS